MMFNIYNNKTKVKRGEQKAEGSPPYAKSQFFAQFLDSKQFSCVVIQDKANSLSWGDLSPELREKRVLGWAQERIQAHVKVRGKRKVY